MKHIRTFLISSLLTARGVLPVASLWAGTYYIDYNTGSDLNNGTSKSTPWKHAPGMLGTTNGGTDACSGVCAAQVPAAGDQYILKGGVVWPYTTLQWNWSWAGTGTTSTYGCTGSGCIYIGVDPTWNLGQVNAITLTRDLGGCTSAPTVTVTPPASGMMATAHAVMMPVASAQFNDFLAYIAVDNPGSGYTANPSVTVTGGGCRNVTAVADIQRAIIDEGSGSGFVWDCASSAYGTSPIRIRGKNFVIMDNLEVRNSMWLSANEGSGSPTMIGAGVVQSITFSNLWVHSWKETTTVPGQPETDGGVVISNNGYATPNNNAITNSFVSNTENVYLCNGLGVQGSPGAGNCWVGNATTYSSLAANSPATYGGTAIEAAAYQANNHVWGARGLMNHQEPASISGQGVNIPAISSRNEVWLGLFSCCGGHGDAFYDIQLGTYYKWGDIIHDIEGGMAAFYPTQSNGSTYYYFNNYCWHIGTATPCIGIDGSFGQGPNPAFVYAFNNWMEALNDSGPCINNGGSHTYDSALTVVAQNNVCVTNSNSASGWIAIQPASTLKNNAGSTNLTNILNSNVVLTPAALTTAPNNYRETNLWAPGNGMATVTFSDPGSNLMSLATGQLAPLDADYNGIARPATGNWQAGPSQYLSSGGDTTPPTISITAPTNGTTVSNTITVAGTAADNVAVSNVQVSVDGGAYAAASGTSNWTFSLNTTALINASHMISAKATDSSGNVSTVASISLTVNNVAKPAITSALTALGTVGTAFSYQITASNSPTSFNATGLPSGLTVNMSNGLISGAPTTAGSSNVTISATNAGGMGSAVLQLTAYSACDVNRDGATNALDIQLQVNQAIGVAPCTSDFDYDGPCNVIEVQRVVNAALGGQCVVGP